MCNPKDKVATQGSPPFSSTPSAGAVGCATQDPLFRPHLATRYTLQQWSRVGVIPSYQD
jgi:hypothetical protein